MKSFVQRVLVALIVIGCFARAASASTISIGFLSFDDLGSVQTFDITNLTGAGALPPDYPVTTQLTIAVTSLTATKSAASGGGTFTLGSSAFTTDGSGNVNCTAVGDASAGKCNFAAYELLNATLNGTISPTSGLAGLPAGFSGILGSFTATLLPSVGNNVLSPGDFVNIDATLVPVTTNTPVPEPSTLILMVLGIGALASYKLHRHAPLLRRFTGRAE